MTSTAPRPLDEELLDRLDAVLAAQPGDLIAAVGSSTPEQHVRARISELGVEPSDEAVLWFTRHEWNSVPILGWQVMSVDQAVSHYRGIRRLAAEMVERGLHDALEDYWAPDWLAGFFSGGSTDLVIDCGPGPRAPSPIRMVDWQDMGTDEYAAEVEPSIGSYIESACALLESGRYHWDPSSECWVPMDWASRPIIDGFRF